MNEAIIKRGPGRPRKTVTPIETKAVMSQSGTTTSIQVNIPKTTTLASDPISLMSYARGYVAICNNIIARSLSTMVFKLYGYQNKTDGLKYINSNKINSFIMKKINTESKALPSRAKKELVEIYDHPFIDLINAPYGDCTVSEFFFLISTYLGLIGNCYLFKIMDDQGQLTGLQVLDSEYVSIQYNTLGEITKYIYQPYGSRQAMEFPVELIVHIKNRTAGSIIVGRGDLENCLEAFAASNEALTYTKTLLQNYCVPGSAVIIKNGDGLTDDAKNLIARNFSQRFSGDSRGRTIVLDADIEIKNMTTSLNDNLTDKFIEISKKVIAGCFGVPLDLIDTTNSNRASSQVAIESMLRFGVYPKLFNILDQINRQIVTPYFSEDLLFWVSTEESQEANPQDQATLYKTYLEMGILSADEIRSKLGFGPREVTIN